MAGDMLPQVLEEMNSLPFEATPAVEGEVKQLDPVALDGCLSTGNGYIARIEGEGDRPNKPSIRSRSEGTKGGPGHKGRGERPELHSASSEYLVPYRQVPFPLLAS